MAATPEHAARVLGLDLQASLKDIRRVRRDMALKYHPDCSNDFERSTRHMARINAAADVLIAYVMSGKSSDAKGKPPRYSDFSNQQRTGAKHNHTAKSEAPRNNDTSKPHDDDVQQKPVGSHNFQHSVSSPLQIAVPRQQTSSEDHRLLQVAINSYRSVLNQIGKVEKGPNIDQKALTFPNSN